MQTLGNDSTSVLLFTALATAITYVVYTFIYNNYFHPLAGFPGPRTAATTTYWKAYIECIANRSFCHELTELHAQYGDIVRVGPNELHFANPQAYHDIYNNKNRWDKEARLYKSFGEDRSSFGYLTYAESKIRKDVLNRSFSRAAIDGVEKLLTEQTKALCAAFRRASEDSKSSDLYYAFRCLSMDIICTFCFGKSIHAVDAPNFAAPIVVAMDASLPVFIRFKYSEVYKNMIMHCPPKLSRVISPSTAGLVDLQELLKKQISDLTDDPEKLKQLPHNMTIYHRLMDPKAFRDGTVPSAGSLYEEGQALMFGGGDTVGNTLMVGIHHLLQQPATLRTLKEELTKAWPTVSHEPTLSELEKLPYLNAVIKESLRMSSGVVSGLLRVTPSAGATINGVAVPPQTIVSCGSTFVHYNASIFPEPTEFRPERWIVSDELDNWLVAFSRGPRMCLGINLAYAELRLGLAHTLRKFDFSLAEPMPKTLPFRDTFLPFFNGQHLKVLIQPTAS